MHSISLKNIYFNKKSSYYHLQLTLFFALIFIALAVALQHYFIIEPNSTQHYSLLWHIPFNIFYWLYWFFITPVIFKIVKKYNQNKFIDYLIIYFAAPIILVSIHQILSAVVINLILDYLDIETLIYRRILRNQWLWVDIVIYFIIETGIYVVENLEENKKEEIKLSQLNNSITEAQISILRSQIHPHFLFNTFNTLSTLILKEDRHTTLKLINSIKELLSRSIKENHNSLISLNEELEFVKNYLEIERLRFGEKLSFEINSNVNLQNALIPNFILQPLVENSVRHGIAKITDKGIIQINIDKENNHLIISVEDNGKGVEDDKIEKGLGLKIIRKQLEYFFEDKYDFKLMKSKLGGLKVLMKIPLVKDKLLV